MFNAQFSIYSLQGLLQGEYRRAYIMFFLPTPPPPTRAWPTPDDLARQVGTRCQQMVHSMGSYNQVTVIQSVHLMCVCKEDNASSSHMLLYYLYMKCKEKLCDHRYTLKVVYRLSHIVFEKLFLDTRYCICMQRAPKRGSCFERWYEVPFLNWVLSRGNGSLHSLLSAQCPPLPCFRRSLLFACGGRKETMVELQMRPIIRLQT